MSQALRTRSRFRKLLQEVAVEQPLVRVRRPPVRGRRLDPSARRAPVLRRAPARPLSRLVRFARRRAGWPITLRLEPLPDDEVDRLILATIGDELRGRPQAAAGNPLVEEMVAVAGEAGAAVAVPPSLKALLDARLSSSSSTSGASWSERRSKASRSAPCRCSAHEPQLGSSLAALVRKDLVRPHRPQLVGESVPLPPFAHP
jgi:hypothetical protein